MGNLAIGYLRDADSETSVHQLAVDSGRQFIQAYGQACDSVVLEVKCYKDWKSLLVLAAKDFMAAVVKWLDDQNLDILPHVDKKDMRCPKCGKEMSGLGNVFIEWGKCDGDEYEEEGDASCWKCECGFQMADLSEFDLDDQKVVLDLDDRDEHSAGCKCGVCNHNNIAHGVLIRYRGTDDGNIERIYGPSEEAAMHNARLRCQELGLTIKE